MYPDPNQGQPTPQPQPQPQQYYGQQMASYQQAPQQDQQAAYAYQQQVIAQQAAAKQQYEQQYQHIQQPQQAAPQYEQPLQRPEQYPQAAPEQPQQQFQAQPTQQSAQTSESTSSNDSKKLATFALMLGAVAFVSGFVGIGILLGIGAVYLAVRVIRHNKPGRMRAYVALGLGGLAVILGPIATILFVILMSLQSVQAQASAVTDYEVAATTVVKKAELYNADHQSKTEPKLTYPTYKQLIASKGRSGLDTSIKNVLTEGTTEATSASSPLNYKGCETGLTVSYWDTTSQEATSYIVARPDLCA